MRLKENTKKWLNADSHTLFGSREEMDNEKAKMLDLNTEFQEDLEKIRNDLFIPYHLTSTRDAYVGYLINADPVYDNLFGSRYTDELLNKQNRERFKKKIVNLLKKYNLGLNFFTWIQWYILYQEPRPQGIALNLRLFQQCIEDPIELFRVPKNGKEIRTIISQIRSTLGISHTGRIPEKYKIFLKTIERILRDKRLKTRKSKIDHSIDYEFFKRHRKIKPLDQKMVLNTTSLLIADLFPWALEEEDFKRAQLMRKRKERLKKQINKLKN